MEALGLGFRGRHTVGDLRVRVLGVDTLLGALELGFRDRHTVRGLRVRV